MNQRIYLDNNATTPIDPVVLQKVVECFSPIYGNPSSIHSYGQASRALLAQSRHEIASYLKVKPEEIVFTSGGTEGMNLLIRGLFLAKEGHIVSSNVEHASVQKTLGALEKEGATVTWLKAGLAGAPSPQQVQEAIQKDTRLLVLSAVNSETGVKIDLEAVAAIAAATQIPLIVDGVALLGKEEFVIPPGVTGMGFSGHKIHAPMGVGFVWIKKGARLNPIVTGGPQENSRRGGTENFPGIVGLAEAVKLLRTVLPEAQIHMANLRNRLEKGLQQHLEGVKVNGTGKRIANITNLSFAGVDGESLIALLDSQGIAVSHGAACASGALEPSRILLNMGLSTAEAASAIRFSLSRFTTVEEIDRTIAITTQLVTQLRNFQSKNGISSSN